jgi:hypothetical protein
LEHSRLPFFSRRRLHEFLNEVQNTISASDVANLARKLDSRDIRAVLGAEAEIAMLWALLKLGPLEYEPDWWEGSRRPDVVTDLLFPGHACALDITSIGEAHTDEELMRGQTHRLVVLANQIRKGSANRLFFNFLPERGYRSSAYVNRLRGRKDTEIDVDVVARFSEWVAGNPNVGERIKLIGDDIAVEVTVHPSRPSRNHRSSKVEGFTDIVRNPIYNKLDQKRNQLKNDSFEGIRAVVLWDVGLTTVYRSGMPHSWEPIYEYKEIIERFILDHPVGLDAVFVVTAREWRANELFFNAIYPSRKLQWHIEPFCNGREFDLSKLREIFSHFPSPRYIPTAVRERTKAGWFNLGGIDQYRSLEISGGPNLPNEVRFSAKALTDFVGGRLSEAEFREYTGLVQTHFESMTNGGRTLTNIKFESGGIDSDDDTVVMEFGFDFALKPFKRD